jgi:hypothetical protein
MNQYQRRRLTVGPIPPNKEKFRTFSRNMPKHSIVKQWQNCTQGSNRRRMWSRRKREMNNLGL